MNGLRLQPSPMWLFVLLFISALYAVWTPDDGLGQLGRDGPRYLMMADHYSFFKRPDPIYAEMAAASQLPPLYPMVLAATASAENLYRAHLITNLFLLLALITYTAWLRWEDVPFDACALLMLMAAVLPASWLAGLLIQSEYLFLFLSLGALSLMSAYGRQPRRDLLYAAALAVGAASLSRTIGVCLFIPLLLSCRRGSWRTTAVAMTLAMLPALSWHFLHRSESSYGNQLLSIYGAHPWETLRTQLDRELPALYTGFAENLLNGEPPGILTNLLGLLCLGSALVRAVQLKNDGVYLAAYLAVVLIWPYPEEAQRLLWAVLPILLAQPVLLFRSGITSGGGLLDRVWPLLVGAMVLSAVLVTFSRMAERYWSAPYSGIPGARSQVSWYSRDLAYASESLASEQAIADAMRLIAQEVPVSDCVLSIRSDVVNYYSHRRSKSPPLNSLTDPEFALMTRRSGCHYIFAMNFTDQVFSQPMHPLQRLSGSIETVYVSAMPDSRGGQQPHILCALVRLLPAKPGGLAATGN